MKKTKNIQRKRRHLRIRKKISGSPDKPRLCIFKSGKHFYASLIDDKVNPCRVITAISSLGKEFKNLSVNGVKEWNIKGAVLVGKLIAEKARTLNIEKVIFDRGGFQYTGRVKSFANAARHGGLKF